MMATKERRAPAGGYDFAAKKEYRDAVWGYMAAKLGPQGCAAAHVLMLPSSEGLEIETAIRHGFREENIHAADASAAVLATAPWRKTYPAVNVYGGKLSRTYERINAKGVKLSCVNLDLCGRFGMPLLMELDALRESRVLHDFAAVAVTIMRGREQPETVVALKLNGRGDGTRTDAALRYFVEADEEKGALPYWRRAGARCCLDVVKGDYRSGTLTMDWIALTTAAATLLDQETTLTIDVARMQENANDVSLMHSLARGLATTGRFARRHTFPADEEGRRFLERHGVKAQPMEGFRSCEEVKAKIAELRERDRAYVNSRPGIPFPLYDAFNKNTPLLHADHLVMRGGVDNNYEREELLEYPAQHGSLLPFDQWKVFHAG